MRAATRPYLNVLSVCIVMDDTGWLEVPLRTVPTISVIGRPAPYSSCRLQQKFPPLAKKATIYRPRPKPYSGLKERRFLILFTSVPSTKLVTDNNEAAQSTQGAMQASTTTLTTSSLNQASGPAATQTGTEDEVLEGLVPWTGLKLSTSGTAA
ncbi:hypothetical protein M0657_010927 [Pyricularia oryzae]|nr:hypothetical protein M9X92_010896 [Pyricularia oryzae]KAI7911500.1 hypothetical protein M0657_010927 [Pyricularia oryzae]